MTELQCLTLPIIICLSLTKIHASEPVTYTINTKKWSHVLDDHFISVTVNPTDLLQGKAFGLGMNSTLTLLKGLSPAYVRIGSADTGKYTFKRSRYPNEAGRIDDEFIVTESHWMVLNDVARSAGLDVIVCLNAAHRNGVNRKWDTRNSLELISFSDSQGYNLTFQLGYEVQKGSGLSGYQYGKDVNRLRTILNAFPRYQNSKLIGPDIKTFNKKDDVEFINEVLLEAGPNLDAVTWHPRWPQPRKMKVSDVSELGYEFPSDYIEWDKSQLHKILQRSIFKTPLWIGEPKTESTGTFAEGLLWARRLVLAAKLGIEVVMKQPNLMDISHPKPEYWIAFLHKRLLGKSVLETRAMNNQSDIAVVTHCTNPLFWTERPNKMLDGAVTIYAVNMGGKDQRLHVKGASTGKSQVMFQYLLTSGSDPDSIFSQMTYLNGEPLMINDDGSIPEIMPRVRRIDRGITFKLPPYSLGFWVVPEARVKICHTQPIPISPANFESLLSSNVMKNPNKNIYGIRNVNQFIVDKLKNPVSESEEDQYGEGLADNISSTQGLLRESSEKVQAGRSSRKVRHVTVEDIGQELKEKIREIREMLEGTGRHPDEDAQPSDFLRSAEKKINSLTDELEAAKRMTDQQEEFGRFLYRAGLNQDFGDLMMSNRRDALEKLKRSENRLDPLQKISMPLKPLKDKIHRFRRSLSYPEDDYEEESVESYSSEEEDEVENRSTGKVGFEQGFSRLREASDKSSGKANFSGLKVFEEKYKNLLSSRVHSEGKKNNMRLPKKNSETEEQKKLALKKENVLGNDLQEEILMKEVEVLQKTEEAMTNLIKNHKKRQQTIEEIILNEITDIKEDRLSALEDMRQHKEIAKQTSNMHHILDEEEIPKKIRRSVHNVLQKNFDFIPNSNQKVKRSIDNVDSNINKLLENSLEEKKLNIVKRSLDFDERPIKRRRYMKVHTLDDDSSEKNDKRIRRSRSERLDRMKNFIQSRERIRDRNAVKKKTHKTNQRHNLNSNEEKSNEIFDKYAIDFFGGFEEKLTKEDNKEVLSKLEAKTSLEREKQNKLIETSMDTGKTKTVKIEDKKKENRNTIHTGNSGTTSSNGGGDGGSGSGISRNGGDVHSGNNSSGTSSSGNTAMRGEYNESQSIRLKVEGKKLNSNQKTNGNGKATGQKPKSEENNDYVPLKIDRNRGLNVLKRISNLVESINTKERTRSRNLPADVEDLSEEFYEDAISKMTKRRHRRSHHKDREDEDEEEEEEKKKEKEQKDVNEDLALSVSSSESNVKTNLQDSKTLRKELKRQKLLDRLNQRKKMIESASDSQIETKSKEQREKKIRSRLKARIQEKLTKRPLSKLLSNETEDTLPLETTEQPPIEILLEGTPTLLNADNEEETKDKKLEKKPENGLFSVQNEEHHGTAVEIAKITKPQEMANNFSAKAITITPEIPFSLPSMDESDDRIVINEQHFTSGEPVMVIPAIEQQLIFSPITEEQQQMQEINEDSVLRLTEADEDWYDGTQDSVLTSGGVTPEFIPQQELATLQKLTKKVAATEDNDVIENEAKIADNDEKHTLSYDEGTFDSDDATSVLHEPKESQMTGRVENPGLDNEDVIKTTKISSNINEKIANFEKDQKSFKYRTSEVKTERDINIPVTKAPTHNYFDAGETNPVLKMKFVDMNLKEGEKINLNGHTENEKEKLHRQRRGIINEEMTAPENRVRYFKRAMHRRHSPYKRKNELPIPGDGDSFWKVAGSTVKAVLDDFIPEAYDKTKDKIEYLGIAEYFKEFGKIVEQMKNLDRLFANIGQAAVKNYIQGSEDEKGDYIQVIDKKRRSRRNIKENLDNDGLEAQTSNTTEGTREDVIAKTFPESHNVTGITETTQPSEVKKTYDIDIGMSKVTSIRPQNKNETQSEKKSNFSGGLKHYIKKGPNDLISDMFLMDTNPGIVEVTKSPQKVEVTHPIPLQPFHSRYANLPERSLLQNNIHESSKEANRLPLNNLIGKQEINASKLQKFTPWMKTTKDFINQALTTLQRQRELSEMIARESVNDLVKREIEKKVIGKRETLPGHSMRTIFPVYQVPAISKREIYSSTDENTSKYLTQLQPGVYIVPTEEMKNLRSEQIMKEAPLTKPGMPNMVTLNIYYDKKKPQEWEVSQEEDDSSPGKMNSNYMKYYQTPAMSYNPLPAVNHPMMSYIPPTKEAATEGKYFPPVQGVPRYHPEPKIHEPLHQQTLHHPGWIPTVQKSYPRPQSAVHDKYFYSSDNQHGQHKSDWTDFRARPSPYSATGSFGHIPVGDPDWAVQFQSTKKKTPRTRHPVKLIDRQNRLYSDKKRSIGDDDPNSPENAMPFWTYFISKEEDRKTQDTNKNIGESVTEADSLEDIFEENRKRASQNSASQNVASLGSSENSSTEVAKSETDEGRKKRDVSQSKVHPNKFHDKHLDTEGVEVIGDEGNSFQELQNKPERLAETLVTPQTVHEVIPLDGELGVRRLRRSADEKTNGNQSVSDTSEKPTLKNVNDEDSSLEVLEQHSATRDDALQSISSPKDFDAITRFFKYAYDSLLQMMRSMTDLI